jgi:mannose-6-phosphate isomerase-like protein (cupin superfamily)
VFVLGGTLLVTLGHDAGAAGLACRAGDVIVVPANSSVRVDNPGGEPASAWVTTSVGLEAVLPDGSRLSPPWVR